MFFRDVIGQNDLKLRLIQSVNEQRISHAQLLYGPQGTGKLPLAIAYARYILCLNRGEKDACGTCASCVKISTLAHPDLHFSFPVIKRKGASDNPISDHFLQEWRSQLIDYPYITENQWYQAIDAEDKQGIINRDESSNIMRKLSLKSYEGEYKILIMWLAEKMNATAANRLLKLIEEPPDKTLFLLISENTDAIISTILSRTQLLRLKPVEKDSMHTGLNLTFNDASESHIKDAIRRANGNYSEALRIMSSEEISLAYFEDFVFLMRNCYGRNIIEVNGWIERIAQLGREKLKDFLTYSLRMIRENFMLNLKQESLSFMSEQEREFSLKFSAFIHRENAAQLAAEFERAISHVEANGYARLILLDLSVKIIMLLKRDESKN